MSHVAVGAGIGIIGGRSTAAWVRASAATLCLVGAWVGAVQAQVVTEFSARITAGAAPEGITAGPDGNLWFTEANGNRIGRITPLGVVTEFSAGITAGAQPVGIAAGPDGNLWFTELTGNRIGRLTIGGVVAPAATSVPTLQQWGLWILGLLIVLVAAGSFSRWRRV